MEGRVNEDSEALSAFGILAKVLTLTPVNLAAISDIIKYIVY